MSTPLGNQSESNSVETARFLRYTAASSCSLKSPAGKILARQFAFRPEALAAAIIYSVPERRRILEQLRIALTDFYVHLERKKSIYGFDPVRALDLLEPSVGSLTDTDFHQAVVQLVSRIRDRHLFFYGRAPVGISAIVPFTVERCWNGDELQFVVTKIDPGFIPEKLQIGAVVTHWNGIPIDRVVRLNANIFDGGNEAASVARSIAFLTHRSLRRFATPLEEWVDLRFLLDGAASEERFRWTGFDANQTPTTPSIGRNLTGFGGDPELAQLHYARRVQFAAQSFDEIGVVPESKEAGVPNIIGTDLGKNFDYGTVTTAHGTFAYIRLWSFNADGPDDIAGAFVSALHKLPRNGLIIDMRGNSGGYIAAGERVLQLLTPQRVMLTRFQFRVTAATRTMVAATDEFQAWRKSFDEAFGTGEPFSQGYPIEGTDEDANRLGQHYCGPVVLITDALAFSTADMFATGFIDHAIGRVICTDENMAAAGSNNWYPWHLVRLFNPDFTLDPALKAAFDAGSLSPGIRDAFNREGASLSRGRPCR